MAFSTDDRGEQGDDVGEEAALHRVGGVGVPRLECLVALVVPGEGHLLRVAEADLRVARLRRWRPLHGRAGHAPVPGTGAALVRSASVAKDMSVRPLRLRFGRLAYQVPFRSRTEPSSWRPPLNGHLPR